uniref:Translocon-associated protein subunit delta n=1 Tax=Schmidtea mediterranea TaxID=79327 RepID=I1ZII5_SCHMD|nr:translocon associated protein subunit delta [Schmidtea mediterranea]
MIFNVLFIFSVIYSVTATTCNNPQVEHNTYSTKEALLSSRTVFVTDITLKCDGQATKINLYAELNGHITLVGKDTETDKYQVTFEDHHRKLPANNYLLKFYDEDTYSVIRKNQRSGESISDIKPLFTINFHHQGVGYGPIVSTETIVILLSSIVCFCVFSNRNKILA